MLGDDEGALLWPQEYLLGGGPVVQLLSGHLTNHTQVVLDTTIIIT